MSKELKRLVKIAAIDSLLSVYLSTFVVGQIYAQMSAMILCVYEAIIYTSTFAVMFALRKILRNQAVNILRASVGLVILLFTVLGINDIARYWPLIGLLRGAILATFYGPIVIIVNTNTGSTDKVNKYNASEQSARQLVSIIAPVALGWLISNIGMSNAALIIIAAPAFELLLIGKRKATTHSREEFNIKTFFSNIDKKSFIRIYCILALNALAQVISSKAYIILLVKINGSATLAIGYIASIIAISKLFAIFIAKKFLTSQKYKRFFVYFIGLGSMVLAAVVAMFPGNLVFIIYQFLSGIFTSATTLVIGEQRFAIGEEIAKKYSKEHNILSELFIFIGRMLAVLIIIFMNIFVGNDLYVASIAMMATGIIQMIYCILASHGSF